MIVAVLLVTGMLVSVTNGRADEQEDDSTSPEALQSAASDDLNEKTAQIRGIIDSAVLPDGPSPGYRVASPDALAEAGKEVKEGVKTCRDEIVAVITTTADSVEAEHNIEALTAKRNLELTDRQKQKLQRLSEAVKETNVSIQSHVLVLRILMESNDALIASAKKERDPDARRGICARQAAFVYELTYVTLEMLDELDTDGILDLTSLRGEEMAEMGGIEGRITQRTEHVVDRRDGRAARGKARRWLGGLSKTRKNWDTAVEVADRQKEWIENARSKRNYLEAILEDASIQVSVLERAMIASKPMAHLRALESLIRTDDGPLLRLDSRAACGLLGIQPVAEPESEQP